MDKLDGMTLDIEKIEKEKLKSIFPQCFVEGELDMTKLLELVGKYDIKDYERYEFTWHGKSECIKNAQARSHGTLRPCEEESKNFGNTDNLYIEGDNLEVLKILQKSYYGKVKLIYIDPPYNTGNDFVYKDNFRDNIRNYKEITSQTTKSNSETMGRFHTDWLNMMYPRLRLAYNLLKDDGVIFISIDDNEVLNLRKICDEVFGEENFVAQFIRNCSNRNQGNFDTRHEYILCYKKSGFFNYYEEKNAHEKSNYIEYNNELISTEDLTVRVGGHIYTIPSLNMEKNFTKKWRYSESDLKVKMGGLPEQDFYEIYLNAKSIDTRWKILGDIIFTNDNTMPYKKKVYSNNQILNTYSFFDIESNKAAKRALLELMNINDVFDNPKPMKTIKKIINTITDQDSIVLDFFSGSATTAHAVMDLNKEDGGNRKFIMVQLPELTDENSEAFKNGFENICEIGKERIRRAGVKINEERPNVDTGFKVFKLDSTNLKIWDNTPIEDEEQLQIDALLNRMNDMIDKVKGDRSDLDVAYEILLKLGYELTETVESFDFSGKKGYVFADGELIVCLDSNVGIDSVEEMIKVKPNTIVFSEDSFAKTEDITNAKLIVGKVLGTENTESIKFKFV